MIEVGVFIVSPILITKTYLLSDVVEKGFRPAALRLIFRTRKKYGHPDLSAPVRALVFWYTKISPRPNPKTGMYEVREDRHSNGNRRAGVVDLARVVGACPLIPIIRGECPELQPEESLDHFESFFILTTTLAITIIVDYECECSIVVLLCNDEPWKLCRKIWPGPKVFAIAGIPAKAGIVTHHDLRIVMLSRTAGFRALQIAPSARFF